MKEVKFYTEFWILNLKHQTYSGKWTYTTLSVQRKISVNFRNDKNTIIKDCNQCSRLKNKEMNPFSTRMTVRIHTKTTCVDKFKVLNSSLSTWRPLQASILRNLMSFEIMYPIKINLASTECSFRNVQKNENREKIVGQPTNM